MGEAQPSNSELPVEEVTENRQQKSGDEQQATGNSQQVTAIDLEFLKNAEAIVKREIKNGLFTIEDLAGELYVSKRQLTRKIKKTTGLPPGKYLREIKLHEAKRILETTEVYTVTEVCAAIGVENVTHFARAFEERFGKNIQDFLIR